MPTNDELEQGIVEWGVFVWNPDLHFYKKENAVKTYSSRKSAERFAEQKNLVVRGLGEDGEHIIYEASMTAWEKHKKYSGRRY